jgi:hypothetical protein
MAAEGATMAEGLAWPQAETRNTGKGTTALAVIAALGLALGLGAMGLVLHDLGPPEGGWTLRNVLRAPLRALVAENGMLTCVVIVFGPLWLGVVYALCVVRRWRGTEVRVTRTGIALSTPWEERSIPWCDVSDVPPDFFRFSVVTRNGDRVHAPVCGLNDSGDRTGPERSVQPAQGLRLVARAYLHLAQCAPPDPLNAPPELEVDGCTYVWLPLQVFGGQVVAMVICAFIFEPLRGLREYSVMAAIFAILILILCLLVRSDIRREAHVYLRADPAGLSFRDEQELRTIPWEQIDALGLSYRGRGAALAGGEYLRLPTGEPRVATVSLLARASAGSTEELLLAAYNYYAVSSDRPRRESRGGSHGVDSTPGGGGKVHGRAGPRAHRSAGGAGGGGG